jgi:predicted transcriptional regulator of viral defense system
MRVSECVRLLWSLHRDVFLRRDLITLLGGPGAAAGKTVGRLVSEGLLERACRGVYVFPYANLPGGLAPRVYRVATALRRGEWVFESLESAASQWGLISQVPVGCLTLMTTGRSGTFQTTCGTIEFTRTDMDALEICHGTVERRGNPVPIATEEMTLRCMRRVGRNMHLVREALDEEGDYGDWI